MKTPYWTRVIANAIRRKEAGKRPFTLGHCRKSRDWCMCACGKQDVRIPRYPNGMPLDGTLASCGFDFTHAVGCQDPEYAAKLLGQIEGLAAVVIADAEREAEGAL